MATAPHRYTNRLAQCKSPYLLQHAHNPVDWYPWGPEAFEKARKEDKPIFLSIGYSTCHWCHVMEHESFEDEELAAILNRDFVSIKVDREERPDLDHIYMNACQLLTQRGGWPMSLFLTAEGKPFYAGTYFPKEDRFGQPGFVTLLSRIAELWKGRQNELASSAEAITDAIRGQVNPPPGMELSREMLKQAYDDLAGSFDEIYGGFGSAPKFPSPHNLSFLLRWWDRSGDDRPLYMVRRTLTQMRQGGVCDHIGLGFHRYSTDREFLLPHFEKMLYDQALLAIAAIETFQATGEDDFARIAQEIFAYILRDMTSPDGAFYSAEDADSEGVEGKFYVWTEEEILDVLGREQGELFCRIYDIRSHGNFLDEATHEETGLNIVHLNRPIHEHSVDLRLTPAELRERLEEAGRKLFEVREKRVHPHKDDKILTSWNGLAIAALAKGFCALGDTHYAAAAMRAADFILSSLIVPDGRLLARYRDGEAAFPAYLDDYAYLVWGLIELYQATFDAHYLEKALALNRQMLELFRDDRNGGFFFTGSDAEELVIRTKEVYDGALPSGNSVAALNLLRLGRITGDRDLEKEADAVFRAFSIHTAQSPSSFCQLLIALDFASGPTQEIILAGDLEKGPGAEMLAKARKRFLPRAVFLHHPEGEEAREVGK